MTRQTPPAAEPEGEPDDVIDVVDGPPADATIFERIAWAQGQVRAVDKRGRNTDQRYDYAKAEDVYAMLRPILAKAGISYVIAMDGEPRLEDTGQQTARGLEYKRWWISVSINLQSPEVPGKPTVVTGEDGTTREVDAGGQNSLQILWKCVADDYSDKGMAKALTLGLKSWLMATFMVSSGTDDAEAVDRQAGTTQRADPPTRRAAGEDTPISLPLPAKQRQAFAASRKVEGDFGPEKAVEITRFITGYERIKDVPDVATLDRLIGAFDRYRTRAEEREGHDTAMAAHLQALQDAAAEGPTRQEPREPDPADAPAADDDDQAADKPFDPATEPAPEPVTPPPTVADAGEQGKLA